MCLSLLFVVACVFTVGWVPPVAGIINESPVYVRTRRVIERMSARMQALEHQHQQQQQQDNKGVKTEGSSANANKPQRRKRHQHANDSAGLSWQQQQRQLLKRRRKRLSHHLLQQIQHSYVTCTAGGGDGAGQQQQLSLLDVYLTYRDMYEPSIPVTRASGWVGMPAGVGDCCAPKLLHAAVQQGLEPVALAECWFGSAPGTSTKAKQGRAVPQLGGGDSSVVASSRQHCVLYGPCEKCQAILGTMLCMGSTQGSSSCSM